MAHSLDRFRVSLSEKSDEIALLKAWEFQELGLQAAERVAAIQGEEALQILQFTSQNFPTQVRPLDENYFSMQWISIELLLLQAKSLLHQQVSDDFRKEMKHNIDVLGRSLNLQPPDAALFVNGLFFDAETLEIGALHETLRSELRVLNGLYNLSKNSTITIHQSRSFKRRLHPYFRHRRKIGFRSTGSGSVIVWRQRIRNRHSRLCHYVDKRFGK